jgi:hypothetical protein
MNADVAKKMLSAVLGFLLITVPPQCAYGYQASGSDSSSGVGGATETAPMSASALQALVAPIALYPDAPWWPKSSRRRHFQMRLPLPIIGCSRTKA